MQKEAQVYVYGSSVNRKRSEMKDGTRSDDDGGERRGGEEGFC